MMEASQCSLRWHRRLLADDFTSRPQEDHVPVLDVHGDDDHIVPYADAGPLVRHKL